MKLLFDAQVPIVKKQLFSKNNGTIASCQPLEAYCPSKQIPSKRYYDFVVASSIKPEDCIIYRS